MGIGLDGVSGSLTSRAASKASGVHKSGETATAQGVFNAQGELIAPPPQQAATDSVECGCGIPQG